MEIINQAAMYNKYTVAEPLHNDIIKDPELYLSTLNKTEIKMLNILFKLASKYNKVHVAQSTLAQWLKLTRQQVNRVIKKLATIGIISKIHRTYDSCLYIVHDFFKKPNIKEQLKKIIPNIVHLCFSIGQLICPALRRKKMEKKEYTNKRIYNARYHRPWVEDEPTHKPQKAGGFKHITEAFCPIVETFKEAEAKAPKKETIPEIPQPCKKLLAERFEELAPQVTPQELERLMTSGRDLKERVKILESFVAMKKFKRENGIE